MEDGHFERISTVFIRSVLSGDADLRPIPAPAQLVCVETKVRMWIPEIEKDEVVWVQVDE